MLWYHRQRCRAGGVQVADGGPLLPAAAASVAEITADMLGLPWPA